MHPFKKITALSLMLVVMVSSIGIAQVSHICKLALAGIESTPCCEGGACETDCCTPEVFGAGASDESDDNCCTDVIKYKNQSVHTTVREYFDSLPDHIAISLFTCIFSAYYPAEPDLVFNEPAYPPDLGGREILNAIQLLLI